MVSDEPNFFDEMYGSGDALREPYRLYADWINAEEISSLRLKSKEAETVFRRTGITFNEYGNKKGAERLIPFDLVPRIISGREWARLERGLKQRVTAINAFLNDMYHRQEIVRAGRVPVELIANNSAFLDRMIGGCHLEASTLILLVQILFELVKTSSLFSKTTLEHHLVYLTCREPRNDAAYVS